MADRVDQLERVTNLLALLLEARRPITLAEIATELVGQYPSGESALRAAFERDKALLRAEGVPIETEILAGDQAGQTGYRIDRRRYELDDLGLTDDERHALQVAVATVRLGTSWGEEALWKVSAGGAGDIGLPGDLHGVAASLPSLPALAPLYDAVSARAAVRFWYHGTPRTLHPFGLLGREGNWYVVGLDVDRGEMRTYRVDRIEGDVSVGESGAFERPEGFDARTAFPSDPKEIGGTPGAGEQALVLIDAARAASVSAEVGDDAVTERRDDGAVVVRVPCANRAAFRSWVLGLVEHAEVLAPQVERDALVDWLRAVAAAEGQDALAAVPDGGGHAGGRSPSGAAPRRRTGPRPASERLRRLLVMLPWLVERGEVPVAEMAATFGLGEAELIRDLELVAMCGLPPYVDELIDVFVDEGMVMMGVPRVFTRPLRLTAPEGFALLAAGRAAVQLPGVDRDGALSRALDKLAAALGEPPVAVELAAPPLALTLGDAASAGAVVTLRYWSAGSGDVTERRVVPRAVFTDRGHWYVLADDLGAGAERTFRVDRIEDLQPTDETVAVRTAVPPTTWFDDEDLPTVRLRLAPATAWVAERYPVTSVEPSADGTTTVDMPVASEGWLARLLLRLGPDAAVVEPERLRRLAAERARGLLGRYEASSASS